MLGGAQASVAAPALRAVGLTVDVLGPDAAGDLRRADDAGIRYTLIHVGADDGQAEGSFARAHHRIELDEVPALAERLRPRERPHVTCLAFGYKSGMPEEATWVVDVRFLDNPYWVEALRPLSGHDRAVVDHVLAQPAALELMDRLESALAWALPLYQRQELVVAFGCTGGRHRSVVLAGEMARRLSRLGGLDVDFVARDLD